MTKRRVSVLVAALVATASLMSGCGGKEERLEAHMQKGREYLEQGNVDKARVEIKNVLQIDPKNADAYLLAGEVEERLQNYQKAFSSFQKALDLVPDSLDAKRHLARLYLFGGDMAGAERVAKEILGVAATDATAQVVLGGVLARKGDADGAIALAEKVIAGTPGFPEAYSLLGGVLAHQGRYDEAVAKLQNGVSANPKDTGLRLALANMAMQRNAPDKAIEQYRALIAMEPKNRDFRLGLSKLLAATKDFPGAEKTLRDAIAADPEDDLRHVWLADYFVATGRADQAEKELRQAMATRPDAYKLYFRLASQLQGENKAEESSKVLIDVISRDKVGPDGLRARNQLAGLRLAQGKSDEAERLIAEVLKENARDNDALMMRGRMRLAAGDALGAIADYRSVLRDQPTSTEVMIQLARAHLANKEPQMAVETIGKVVSLNPKDAASRLLLADVLATTGDRKAAANEVQGVLKDYPQLPQALSAKAGLESAAREWRAAERTLSQLLEVSPKDAQAAYQLGQVQLEEKKIDAALASFEKSLASHPGAIEPLTGIANARVAQAKPDMAVQRIRAELHERPDNFPAQALLAHVIDRQGNRAEAEAAYRQVISAAPKVPASYLELAGFYRGHNDAGGELKAIEQGLGVLPNNPALLMQLGGFYLRAKQPDKAIAQYEAVLGQHPDDAAAANNLASLLLDTRKDRSSIERAWQLAERFKNSANLAYLDTYGWAGIQAGKLEEGAAALRKVNDQAPEVPVFQYHLGAALKRMGDTQAALPLLRKAASAQGDVPGKREAKELLAEG